VPRGWDVALAEESRGPRRGTRGKKGEKGLLPTSFSGSGSLPLLPQSHYSFTLFSAGASSHLSVPIFDLFTAFTGADRHHVLLVPHSSFLSVK